MAELGAASDNRALRTLLEERLRDTRPPDEHTPINFANLSPEQLEQVRHLVPATHVPAAVLVPIIDHPDGLTILFTERAANLRSHAGQISFPGGRIEPQDEGPLAAALRETEEEIGLPREHVRVLGYLPPHMIFTGFCVSPVVGLVRPDFALRLDAREVAGVFEAPLTHILDPQNYVPRERNIGDVKVMLSDITYGEHRIWGATAGMVMSLRQRLALSAP